VAPTAEPVPVTRKSPTFHFAVPIVTLSVTGATLTGADGTDIGPKPLVFFAWTVKEYEPAPRSLMVRNVAVVYRRPPAG
jgi:hypothetical protein